MSGGFNPVQDISGTQYTGKTQSRYVPSTHATLLQVGDLVVDTGDVTTVGEVSYPNSDAAAAAGLITGVITGIDFNPQNLNQQGLPAGIGSVIEIAPAFSDLLLTAEISQAITTTQVGQNGALLATAATQSGGLAFSNMKIDTSSLATSSNQLRIENLIAGAVAANSRVYCRINPAFSTVGASVGV